MPTRSGSTVATRSMAGIASAARRSRGRATTPGDGFGLLCADRWAGSASAIASSTKASCCATARCISRPTRIRPTDPLLALRAGRLAAEREVVIDRDSLERLAERAPHSPTRGRSGARELLVGLLLTGQHAIPVIEALDHREIWTRLLPEWQPVRSRPQHNSYHRFTVDRHLLETTANAASYADRVDRPDLLVMGALMHDLGKATPKATTLTSASRSPGASARASAFPTTTSTCSRSWSPTTCCCRRSPCGATSTIRDHDFSASRSASRRSSRSSCSRH